MKWHWSALCFYRVKKITNKKFVSVKRCVVFFCFCDCVVVLLELLDVSFTLRLFVNEKKKFGNFGNFVFVSFPVCFVAKRRLFVIVECVCALFFGLFLHRLS